MTLSSLSLATCVLLTEFAGDSKDVLLLSKVFAFAGKFGISAAFSSCYILAAELYPTMTRTIAVGTASTVSRFGSILCPYVIMLKKYHKWLPNTVFAALGLIAGGLALIYPETNDCVMLESLEDAEEFYRTGKTSTKNYTSATQKEDNETGISTVVLQNSSD